MLSRDMSVRCISTVSYLVLQRETEDITHSVQILSSIEEFVVKKKLTLNRKL